MCGIAGIFNANGADDADRRQFATLYPSRGFVDQLLRKVPARRGQARSNVLERKSLGEQKCRVPRMPRERPDRDELVEGVEGASTGARVGARALERVAHQVQRLGSALEGLVGYGALRDLSDADDDGGVGLDAHARSITESGQRRSGR